MALLAVLAAAGLLLAGSSGEASPSAVAVTAPPGSAVVGSWAIAGATLTLNADGTWTGFDGCDHLRGNWLVLDEGQFAASATSPASPGCGALALGALLTSARRVDVVGDRLLLTEDGTGRVRALARAPSIRTSNRSSTASNVP